MKDKNAFFQYRSMPEIYQYQAWRPKDIDEIEEFINKNISICPNTRSMDAIGCVLEGRAADWRYWNSLYRGCLLD